jgi:predicted RNase H-like HicB family nuclease
MKFTVNLDRNEDGVWVAECPAIPGCIGQGRTVDEALENAQDAIKACLEVRAERGMPLTIESTQVEVIEREVALVHQRQDLMSLLEQRSKPEKISH